MEFHILWDCGEGSVFFKVWPLGVQQSYRSSRGRGSENKDYIINDSW